MKAHSGIGTTNNLWPEPDIEEFVEWYSKGGGCEANDGCSSRTRRRMPPWVSVVVTVLGVCVMKIYRGVRTEDGRLKVTVNGEPLDRYLHWNWIWHRFECGYGGSGAAQLAFAILAEHTENQPLTFCYYQAFKWEVIAKLPRGKNWELSEEEVEGCLTAIKLNHELPTVRALNG